MISCFQVLMRTQYGSRLSSRSSSNIAGETGNKIVSLNVEYKLREIRKEDMHCPKKDM